MTVNVTPSSSAQSTAAYPKTTLSTHQQQLIRDTLTQVDPAQLTQAQAQTIVKAFRQAGIQPSRALAEEMSAAGFDARSVGELAGVRPPPPKPTGAGSDSPRSSAPSAGSEGSASISDLLEYLEELLSQYGEVGLGEEDKSSILQAMRDRFGMPDGASLINVVA